MSDIPDEPRRIELNTEELRQKINLETGKLGWPELQRHFARGVLVVVSSELDLIEVAASIAEDDAGKFDGWFKTGMIGRASDDDAKRWQEGSPVFWSAVVAPWVLVQEITVQ